MKKTGGVRAAMRGLAAALLLSLVPAGAATARVAEVVGSDFKPGDYVWHPERAAEGPMEIVISLALQRAFVYRGGTLIGASTISSGKAGAESPIGRFQILEKKRMHRSNRYNDAPMPFMQRLNWYGVALHGGYIPGYPASHGCIRLPMGFAKALFTATAPGTFVYVADETVQSLEAILKLARSSAGAPLQKDRAPRGSSQGTT